MRCGVGSFFPVLGSSLVLNRIALAVQELGLGLQCLRSNCGETLLKKNKRYFACYMAGPLLTIVVKYVWFHGGVGSY